jgi:hypothetical protein
MSSAKPAAQVPSPAESLSPLLEAQAENQGALHLTPAQAVLQVIMARAARAPLNTSRAATHRQPVMALVVVAAAVMLRASGISLIQQVAQVSVAAQVSD